MLLCDAATESGGKLFVLGGGWSVVHVPNIPTPMALAIKLMIPWDQANQKHHIKVSLVTDDGDTVDAGEGPIQADGQIEVGRPPGMKPGTPLDSPFVVNFAALALDAGGYVWELEVDGTVLARTPFRVLGD